MEIECNIPCLWGSYNKYDGNYGRTHSKLIFITIIRFDQIA